MFTWDFYLACVLLGTAVGFFAGLFGIGGGGLMVPILTLLFLWQKLPSDNAVHLALGTSMAAIIPTAFASLRAHHKKDGVLWPVARAMAPGLVFGAFAMTFLVAASPSVWLGSFFALFMVCVAAQMAFGLAPSPQRQLPKSLILTASGGVIGAISALVSIGGGTLSVPFLHWHNVPINRAIGTSAALGIFIALAGTFGYLIQTMGQSAPSMFTFGFIHWPAVMSICLISFFTAPLGVKCHYRLPVSTLKRMFALLLVGLSVSMLLGILNG